MDEIIYRRYVKTEHGVSLLEVDRCGNDRIRRVWAGSAMFDARDYTPPSQTINKLGYQPHEDGGMIDYSDAEEIMEVEIIVEDCD